VFPIAITIYFQDPSERPVEYTHQLKIEADPASFQESKHTHKRLMAPVVFEKYNELTFFEPTDWFYDILKKNSYESYKARWDRIRNEQAAPGGVNAQLGHLGGFMPHGAAQGHQINAHGHFSP